MVDNHLYNLMMQMGAESKSLKRINDSYLADSSDCADCKDFWARMKKDKEEHIEELSKLMKSHMA